MRAGTPKRGWSSKIGRGFLTLTDSHMTRVRDSFLPIDFSANSTPQMINVLQYATKTYPTPDPNLNQ